MPAASCSAALKGYGSFAPQRFSLAPLALSAGTIVPHPSGGTPTAAMRLGAKAPHLPVVPPAGAGLVLTGWACAPRFAAPPVSPCRTGRLRAPHWRGAPFRMDASQGVNPLALACPPPALRELRSNAMQCVSAWRRVFRPPARAGAPKQPNIQTAATPPAPSRSPLLHAGLNSLCLA